MIIKFEKVIYEKNCTGNVDRVLSYDTEKSQFTVQDVKSEVIRKHNTPLELKNMGFNSNLNNSSRKEKEEVQMYLRELKIIKFLALEKIPQIIFAVREIKDKTLVYLADKKTFEDKSETIDPYNSDEYFTDELCSSLELSNQDECVYSLKTQTSEETIKSNLEAYGLYENTELLKEF